MTAILLFGCSDSTEGENSAEIDFKTPVTFTNKGQEFTIIPFYQEYLNYIEGAKKQEANLKQLYYQTVKQPFLVNAFGEEFKDGEIEDWTLSTPTPINELEKSVQNLIENQSSINEIVKQTLKESSDKLPGGKKSIYIIPANPTNTSTMKFLNGVTGVTWQKDVILIQIEPSLLKDEYLNYSLAHEYHHSVFMENNELDYNTTLKDDVILEGKAETFARSLYPDIIVPWHKFPTIQMEENAWEFFKENTSATDLAVKEVLLFGKAKKNIPDRAIYTLGNKIMNSFTEENPNIPIEEWTDMSANEILLESQYEEYFEGK
ncbi:DUF2268 domain-containing protein [Saliterribacillus persicus]|uniref:Uncharacterized protein YjaZ n=1 Tax=Saliterribacillus persicus TaxID=930114 RepID=A0A368X9N3_9BACI|nr:DUF2268 domain-containing putative Zn-dependent protease [Saliterribacillus persicus]RCW63946.1 uncharacterized protein YjaZ [Saliterribacillus persicus]